MKKSVFQEGKKYTFSDYFHFNSPPEEIVAELGYSLTLENLQLPRSKDVDPNVIHQLQTSYYELLPKITLSSEIAKREFMIAPLLYEVIRQIDAKLNVEYPIEISEKLSGSFDYLIRSKQELVVVEAKKGDLGRGFNQLAAELIALDQYEERNPPEVFYGAITIGELWRFALLDRNHKSVTKDIHTFRFPEDVQDIFGILKGILKKDSY